MRAVQVTRHGPPREVVEVRDVEVPEPDAGEVLISASAGSLNFGDIARCRGGVASALATPPFTLGMDVAGTVDAAGPGAEQWVGKRVVAVCKQAMGGLAEFAVAPTASVFDAPTELDDVHAAAFTLPFHTTALALHQRAGLQPDEWLLVTAAAGALGTAAIQLGVAAGAQVVAVVGSPEKAQVCTDLGAELVIDRSAGTDLFDQVMDHTAGHGVDVACDLVGGEATEELWTTMAFGGRYLAVGFNDDPDSGMTGRPLRKVSTGNFSVVGVLAGYGELPVDFRRFGLHPFPPEVGQQVHKQLCEQITSGSIRPVIGQVIGPDQVGVALDDHDSRRTTGRTVVDLTR